MNENESDSAAMQASMHMELGTLHRYLVEVCDYLDIYDYQDIYSISRLR